VLDRTVDNLAAKQPLMVIATTFLVIAGLYWLMKRVTVALLLQRQYAEEMGRRQLRE